MAEAATAAVAAAVARGASTVARMDICPETAPSLRKEVAAEEAETASTAGSPVTCLAIARNPRNPESLVVVAAVDAHASIVAKPDTCLGSAQSQRSRENLDVLEADQLARMTIELVSVSDHDVARFLLP